MRRAKGMEALDFIRMTISHNLKDPHPKALEPDCFSPFLAIATQSLRAGSFTLRKSKEVRQVLLEGIKTKHCHGDIDDEGMVDSKSSSREWFNGNADST
jgi:hypothetical protein